MYLICSYHLSWFLGLIHSTSGAFFYPSLSLILLFVFHSNLHFQLMPLWSLSPALDISTLFACQRPRLNNRSLIILFFPPQIWPQLPFITHWTFFSKCTHSPFAFDTWHVHTFTFMSLLTDSRLYPNPTFLSSFSSKSSPCANFLAF